jgi:hypothetical protein
MRILPAFAVALFIAAGAITTQASPLMPAKALVSPEASDEATLVRHRGHWRHHRHWRHYGWRRGHHYGWRHHRHRHWR